MNGEKPVNTNHAGAPGPVKGENFAVFSMVSGIVSLLFCFIPPFQLLCGSTAIMLAILSKRDRPLSRMALSGVIMGIISIIISFFIFYNFITIMDMMKQDPSLTPQVNAIMEQYQSMFQSLVPQQ